MAARGALERSGIDPSTIDSVVAGNMAPGGFDQFYFARHVGLYAGVQTGGNSSALTDAAASAVVTSRAVANEWPATTG